jgi:small subunit ribosomal protein S18
MDLPAGMGKKLFVSNIDFDVKEDILSQMFKEVGGCISVVMALDRETKRSKGFAFVEMESDEDANRAIEQLNNKVVNGRPMKVTEDRGKGGGGAPASDAAGAEGSEGGRGERRRGEFIPPMQRLSLFRRRKKADMFEEDPSRRIDFRDVSTLGRFVSERGKILSRRLTGLSAYHQRRVSRAIKRAQQLGLMPFTNIQR